MSLFHTNTLLGASGSAGGPLYVDDVFSVDLYQGADPTAKTITSGIDLSGKGGLVWTKKRNAETAHFLFDSERGDSKSLSTNSNDAENDQGANALTFNSDGHTVRGNFGNLNGQNQTYAAWTFRKAPGFFDVVSWTGTGDDRNISHDLGSVPGCIILKRTDTSHSKEWIVYHRSAGTDGSGSQNFLKLNSDAAAFGDSGIFPSSPTSTQFTVSGGDFNASGGTAKYVAYVFAHDDQSFGTDEDEAIIKCGSFTGGNHTESLGFEPQWLLAKRTDTTGDWFLVDNMRGFLDKSQDSKNLRPNTADDENTAWFHLTSDGFYYSSSSATYIYIAIRRPNKPPEAATDVFDVNTTTTSSSSTTFTSGFVTDAIIYAFRASGYGGPRIQSRITGNNYNVTATSAAESATTTNWDSMTGVTIASSSGISLVDYMFKRAPGFFDVVTFEVVSSGSFSDKTVNHNLGVAPGMIWVKRRDDVYGFWPVYHSSLNSGYPHNAYMKLNENDSVYTSMRVFGASPPSSTQFTVRGSATGLGDQIAYLFGELAGVSKIGSYTGTGNNVDVDCGFTAGARFVMIKRSDDNGDWTFWDTARGIVAGNDPYHSFNSDTSPFPAEVTNTDYIDPLNSGFTVTSSAPAALNTSGGNYIFLAIA